MFNNNKNTPKKPIYNEHEQNSNSNNNQQVSNNYSQFVSEYNTELNSGNDSKDEKNLNQLNASFSEHQTDYSQVNNMNGYEQGTLNQIRSIPSADKSMSEVPMDFYQVNNNANHMLARGSNLFNPLIFKGKSLGPSLTTSVILVKPFDKGFLNLLDAIRNNDPNVTKLDLRNKNLGDREAIALAEAIRINRFITLVDLSGNNISDIGAKSIAKLVIGGVMGTKVNWIDLRNNNIQIEGYDALTEAMKVNGNITYFGLDKNSFNKGHVVEIQSFVERNKGNKKLEESYLSEFENYEFTHLLSRIESNEPDFIKVDLRNKNIGDKEAIALAEALAGNKYIKFIDLSDNKIGDEGAIALGSIPATYSMMRINLKNNNISAKGLDFISNCVKQTGRKKSPYFGINESEQKSNVTQTKIVASEEMVNEFESGAWEEKRNMPVTTNSLVNEFEAFNKAEEMVSEFESGSWRTKVDVNTSVTPTVNQGNEFTQEFNDLLLALKNNDPNIKNINLRNKNLGDKEAIALAEAISKYEFDYDFGDPLLFIDLGNNDIGDEGAKALAEVISRNCYSSSIDLSFNNIGDEGVKALSSISRRYNTINWICLKGNNFGEVGLNAWLDSMYNANNLTYIGLTEDNNNHKQIMQVKAFLKRNKERLKAIEENNKTVLEVLSRDNVQYFDENGNRIPDHVYSKRSEVISERKNSEKEGKNNSFRDKKKNPAKPYFHSNL